MVKKIPSYEVRELIRELRNSKTCPSAQEKLGQLGAPAVPFLVKALKEDVTSLQAAEVLKKIGESAVEPLIRVLVDKKTSGYAACILEDIGTPSVEPLINALKIEHLRLRILAVRALGNIGDVRAVLPLKSLVIESIIFDRSAKLLDAIFTALGEMGEAAEREKHLTIEEIIAELAQAGFKRSGRSDRLYYKAEVPDVRFSVGKRIIRLERRERIKKRSHWVNARSFSIATEQHFILLVARSVSAK